MENYFQDISEGLEIPEIPTSKQETREKLGETLQAAQKGILEKYGLQRTLNNVFDGVNKLKSPEFLDELADKLKGGNQKYLDDIMKAKDGVSKAAEMNIKDLETPELLDPVDEVVKNVKSRGSNILTNVASENEIRQGLEKTAFNHGYDMDDVNELKNTFMNKDNFNQFYRDNIDNELSDRQIEAQRWLSNENMGNIGRHSLDNNETYYSFSDEPDPESLESVSEAAEPETVLTSDVAEAGKVKEAIDKGLGKLEKIKKGLTVAEEEEAPEDETLFGDMATIGSALGLGVVGSMIKKRAEKLKQLHPLNVSYQFGAE